MACFQRLAAGVVFAVGHHQQNFLLQRATLLQVVGRCDRRVVERGTAARFDALQRILQLGNAAGVILVEEILLVEVDDEDLVLRDCWTAPG